MPKIYPQECIMCGVPYDECPAKMVLSRCTERKEKIPVVFSDKGAGMVRNRQEIEARKQQTGQY